MPGDEHDRWPSQNSGIFIILILILILIFIFIQASVDFVAWASDRLTDIPKNLAIHRQFDRASTSIPLNIAEGNGKKTAADRCRFFDNARGSALECAACLDVLVAKKTFTESVSDQGKGPIIEIVSMRVGLIRSNSPDRDI